MDIRYIALSDRTESGSRVRSRIAPIATGRCRYDCQSRASPGVVHFFEVRATTRFARRRIVCAVRRSQYVDENRRAVSGGHPMNVPVFRVQDARVVRDADDRRRQFHCVDVAAEAANG